MQKDNLFCGQNKTFDQLLKLCSYFLKYSRSYTDYWIKPSGEAMAIFSGHRGDAREWLKQQITNILNIPYKKYHELNISPDELSELLKQYIPDDKKRHYAIFASLEWYDYPADYYVMKYEGWIRVSENYIELYGLTSDAMRNIANLLKKEDCDKAEIIEDLQNGARYLDIPIDVLSSGSIKEMKEYRR